MQQKFEQPLHFPRKCDKQLHLSGKFPPSPKGAPEAEAEATLKMEALSSAKANLIQGP